MYCKYCKKRDHDIDNCKDIMCKTCKQYGHPHWKCNNSNNNNNNGNNNGNNNNGSNSNNSNSNNEKRKKPILNIVDDNINLNYFIKYLDISWAEID